MKPTKNGNPAMTPTGRPGRKATMKPKTPKYPRKPPKRGRGS